MSIINKSVDIWYMATVWMVKVGVGGGIAQTG